MEHAARQIPEIAVNVNTELQGYQKIKIIKYTHITLKKEDNKSCA